MTDELQIDEHFPTFEERVATLEAYVVKFAGTPREEQAKRLLANLLEKGSL